MGCGCGTHGREGHPSGQTFEVQGTGHSSLLNAKSPVLQDAGRLVLQELQIIHQLR